ncbi:DUF2878 domain-containing protein [uncultured Enterobacter sp.]|uniref:DUF2878 domain-containing protein n=1 Tax=uncultured Enterobacter sp. TaxID=238202 RepID=UPI0026128712|nr:DUF2878 domain-containing protein [uncultured Enterobacter sp.]
MRRYGQVILLAIGFDLYWTLVVLFRERGLMLWLALAILAWLMLPPPHRLNAALLAAVGCALDSLWALTGLIAFAGKAVMPLWMIALWLMFASVWTGLTRATTLPGWLLILLATAGGPVAYLVGERLGGIVFLQPAVIVIGWMVPGWLVLMLFFHFMMGRQR